MNKKIFLNFDQFFGSNFSWLFRVSNNLYFLELSCSGGCCIGILQVWLGLLLESIHVLKTLFSPDGRSSKTPPTVSWMAGSVWHLLTEQTHVILPFVCSHGNPFGQFRLIVDIQPGFSIETFRLFIWFYIPLNLRWVDFLTMFFNQDIFLPNFRQNIAGVFYHLTWEKKIIFSTKCSKFTYLSSV